MISDQPLWTPSPAAIRTVAMTRFRSAASEAAARTLADYDALHRWSIDETEAFWGLLWSFCGVRGEPGQIVLADADRMPWAKFFP